MIGKWKPKPADVVSLRPRRESLRPVNIRLTPAREPSTVFNPSLTLIYAFAALIAIGSILLWMPFSHHGEGFTPFVDALFTATSAGTVTGLVVHDTGSYWTLQGQVVILLLMFVGGLGIMTIASALFILAGQRVTLTQRLVIRETVGTAVFANITSATVRIVLWAAAIQAAGIIALTARFLFIYPPAEAVWHGLFQGVSGFNNAGFVSFPDASSLSQFRTDWFVIGATSVLILLGALSYWVIDNVVRARRFSRLTLNSKLALTFTAALLAAGAVAYYVSELGNPDTLRNLSAPQQAAEAVFHSINRTSGFATVGFGDTRDETNVFYMALMFVGGASASVAGGIKVNTLAIIFFAAVAVFQGRRTTTAFGRRIPAAQVTWAIVVAALCFVCVYAIAIALTFFEPQASFNDLLFEAVSAFGTVGFSAGATAELSTPSRVILSVAMFIGRVGPPLAIVKSLSRGKQTEAHRYPRERALMG